MIENPLMHRDKLYEGIYTNVNQLLSARLLQKPPRVGKRNIHWLKVWRSNRDAGHFLNSVESRPTVGDE